MQYDLKHRKNTTRPYDKPVMDPESDPAIPNSMRSRIDAIKNVDIHAGSSLHLEDSLKSRIEHSIGFKMDNVELREPGIFSGLLRLRKQNINCIEAKSRIIQLQYFSICN